MPLIIPKLSPEQLSSLPSNAEKKVYESFNKLKNENSIILFSMNWVRIGIHGAPRDGETDFVFMDPNSGILAIEVKGGRIDYDPGTGKWFSWDRHNQKQSIKDPFQKQKSKSIS